LGDSPLRTVGSGFATTRWSFGGICYTLLLGMATLSKLESDIGRTFPLHSTVCYCFELVSEDYGHSWATEAIPLQPTHGYILLLQGSAEATGTGQHVHYNPQI
jgi:hypothetical protein